MGKGQEARALPRALAPDSPLDAAWIQLASAMRDHHNAKHFAHLKNRELEQALERSRKCSSAVLAARAAFDEELQRYAAAGGQVPTCEPMVLP